MQAGTDYIGVACVFCCHDGTGRLLLHKRSAKTRDEHGRWDFGGGKLHFGESWEQAVAREVAEEYGATAGRTEHIHTYNSLRTHKGQPTHWVALIFAVQVDPAEVRNNEPEKLVELGWFTLETLPEPLHSQIPAHSIPALQSYFSRQHATMSSQ